MWCVRKCCYPLGVWLENLLAFWQIFISLKEWLGGVNSKVNNRGPVTKFSLQLLMVSLLSDPIRLALYHVGKF